MLIATTSAGFGAPPEQAQLPSLTARGQSLAVAETSLRNSFGRYVFILTAFKDAGKPAPAALKSMLQRYNAAQVAYTEAANFWLIARAGVPRDQLPDPDAVPESVPAFDPSDLAANGFGSTFNPGAIRLIVGPVGKPRRITLGEYAPYYYANGLGLPPVLVAIFIISVVAITGAVIISVFGKTQAAADIAANQAATAAALARQAEVESDERTLKGLLDSCIGANSDDADVRFKCAELALNKFPDVQAGRPSTNVPGTSNRSIFTVIGVLAVLGVAGTAGYYLYRNQRGGSSRLPRAYARTHTSSSESDESEESGY